MKAIPILARLLALWMGFIGVMAIGNDQLPSANSEQVRAAITKGLNYLSKDGDQWIAEKSCNGCHHLPELLWSHGEALRRGFAIDTKKLQEWTDWAKPLAKNKGPGLEELALMILAQPKIPAAELSKVILAEQKPDGSWTPGGQLSGMQRRGAEDAKANSVRLFLLALATADPGSPTTEDARKKAAVVLEKSAPPTSLESWVFRGLYAQKFGLPEEVAAIRSEIIKTQHDDGGWSSFLKEPKSDSLATGQALYFLQSSSAEPNVAAAITRAQQWLLTTQQEDGAWVIDIAQMSQVDRSDPKKGSVKNAAAIYKFWGSAWATIGLLQSVPLQDSGKDVVERSTPQ